MNHNYSEFPPHKKIYFASDFHLGNGSHTHTHAREKKIVRWLNTISDDAHALFLVGDIFDFWFEYDQTVPKGYVRFLGKLAELADRGVHVLIFSGNHDIWLQDYLEKEVGARVLKEPASFNLGGQSFYIGHGDGLGPGDNKFKFFKKIFTNRLCIWLFKWLHPDIGVALGRAWSNRSRHSQLGKQVSFYNEEEPLVVHSRTIKKYDHHDYFIYGHQHLAMEYDLGEGSIYINLGEWTNLCSYASWDGKHLELTEFGDEN